MTRQPTRERRSWTIDSRRWAAYRPRPDDIVIATAPKCGTTWTQQIVSLLVFRSPEPRPVQTLSPWVGLRMVPLEDMVAEIEAQTHRRFLKSHLGADSLPLYDTVRYIHTARDGRDAFMSWFNHCNGYTEQALALHDASGQGDETLARPLPRVGDDPRAYFEQWMTEGPDARLADDYPAAEFFAIERSWWDVRHLPNVLLVHYNDLKADLPGEMRRIAGFLEIDIPDALWPSLIDAASFQTMRTNGAALLPRAAQIWDGGHERFLKEGTNGRWRDVLSEEQRARYQERAARELEPDLARWLETGRLAADDPDAT